MLNRLFINLIVLLAAITCCSTVAIAQDAVLHDLSVKIDPASHHISVTDQITLPENMRAGVLEFSLSAVLEITDSQPVVTKIAAEDKDEHVARYKLDSRPDDGIVKLTYSGAYDFGLSDQKEEYTRGFRETVGTIDPVGIYLDGGSSWVPQFNDGFIRFIVRIEQPEDWHVISQGNGTSRDKHGVAHWESGGLLEQIYLVGGPLVVAADSAGAVETLVYLHEKDDAITKKYLDATAQYLEMYRQLLGPYPYKKFALVENFWETGYGMPSFTLLGPQVIRFPFILHSSYPHEILHNWWGNSVFVDYESGNWCEGLTAYMADHLIQEQRGAAVKYRQSTLQKYRNYVRDGLDFPLSEFRSRHSAATEAVGYGKSLMTFHMLRRKVGDDAFRAAMASFYRKNRGKRASFSNIRAAFESVTENDHSSFFDQWVNRVGAPSLVLNDITVKSQGDGFVIHGSIDQVQEIEPFALDVPLQIQTQSGIETVIVSTNQRKHSFEVSVSSQPLTIAADPMFDLFRLLDPRETPPSIGQIFGDSKVLAVLPSDATETEINGYRELMQGWQTDVHNVEITFDSKLDSLPSDRAVWLLGSNNKFAYDLASADANVIINDEAITIAGEEVSAADHCTVIIWRNPDNMNKAIGWITVNPADAFAGMARKLPHYGKYSYLAFEGSEPTNTVKGQWDTNNSPLVVDLGKSKGERLPALAAISRDALATLPPTFSRKALMDHVNWLASTERAGRGLGTQGLDESALYIAQAMEDAGLEPGGDNGSWFQQFTVSDGPNNQSAPAMNVIGFLSGTNADWSDQSIILSAHYDHLGLGWPDNHAGDAGKIHPGADDNASGIAVMLELAKNLAAEKGGSRNLVVIAFSAEESGRNGSKYYVQNPRFPLEDIRGVINLDTVGRLFDGQVSVHGTATADEWQHIFRGSEYVTGVKSKIVPGAAEGSDQASFIEKGIPSVQIFTGAHVDYHRPSDTADKIDDAGLVKVATFVKEAVVYMLAREEPLTIRIEGTTAQTPKRPAATGGRRVSFGTVPDFAYQGNGVMIDSLVADSPAEKAGLLAGDILIALDGKDIADLRAFSNFLKTLSPGQSVKVTVDRNGERVSATVIVKAR